MPPSLRIDCHKNQIVTKSLHRENLLGTITDMYTVVCCRFDSDATTIIPLPMSLGLGAWYRVG